MWTPIELPYICERVIAFSIPEGDEICILSYEGLHLIRLAPDVHVWTDVQHAEDYDIYDVERGVLEYRGRQYRMLGLYGGEPILLNSHGDRLHLQPAEERLAILGRSGEIRQVISYQDLSGDWVDATFSPDGRYLVIGVPYDLYVYREFSQ